LIYRRKIIFVLIFLCFVCVACSTKNANTTMQEAHSFKMLSSKEQVRTVHLENLKIFLNEDAEGIVNAFSPNYKDMFRSKDGNKADVSKTYFEDWFKSENYKACKKLKLDELVNVEDVKVYSYDEIMKMNHVAVGVKNVVGFEYKDGDILIKFPKKENSPMINGWNGVYRKENGYWKIIAGNF